MKLSLFLLPALSWFAVAAPAKDTTALSPAAKKADNPNFAPDLVKSLTAEVKPLIAELTSIVNALPADATTRQKKAAAAKAIPHINTMTADFKASNAKISQRQATLGNFPHAVLGQLNGQPIVVAKLLLPLIKELDPVLTSVLDTLSLEEVNAALQPLLKVELPALITGLGNLVNGLLAALSPLLAGLGGILGPLLLGLGL